MKIYNKKGLLAGIGCIVLAVWNVILDVGDPDPIAAVQIRNSILYVVLFLSGISSFWRALSKKETKEDFIEEQDERNNLIEYKTSKKMLEIAYAVLFVVMIGGVVGFKMTADMIWFAIFLIPGFLLGLFLLIEIFVKLYYDKRG